MAAVQGFADRWGSGPCGRCAAEAQPTIIGGVRMSTCSTAPCPRSGDPDSLNQPKSFVRISAFLAAAGKRDNSTTNTTETVLQRQDNVPQTGPAELPPGPWLKSTVTPCHKQHTFPQEISVDSRCTQLHRGLISAPEPIVCVVLHFLQRQLQPHQYKGTMSAPPRFLARNRNLPHVGQPVSESMLLNVMVVEKRGKYGLHNHNGWFSFNYCWEEVGHRREDKIRSQRHMRCWSPYVLQKFMCWGVNLGPLRYQASLNCHPSPTVDG